MWIKILLIAAVVAVTLTLTRSTGDSRHQALRRILLALFILAAAVTVLWPPLLTRLANALGVGRGTDLLLYALVIAFVSSITTSYRRLHGLARDLTVLARETTLLRARVAELEQAHDEAPRTPTATEDLHKSSTPGVQSLPQQEGSNPYDAES